MSQKHTKGISLQIRDGESQSKSHTHCVLPLTHRGDEKRRGGEETSEETREERGGDKEERREERKQVRR